MRHVIRPYRLGLEIDTSPPVGKETPVGDHLPHVFDTSGDEPFLEKLVAISGHV
jgi:hypothetical protein